VVDIRVHPRSPDLREGNIPQNRQECLPRRARKGTVLVVAMIIIFALASLALVLGSSMRVEATAASNRLAAQQAMAVERGAEQYVLALLTETPHDVELLEESEFEARPIGRGYFWILKPDFNDPTLPLYGLTDESCRLDLNTANYETLRRLPGMTDEIAGAIVDWRDEDETVSENGSESQAYAAAGYRAKNAPFETVEELRLVTGMTPELLYGVGNTSWSSSSSPSPTAASGQPSNPFGEQYEIHGLAPYFTIWSRQSNTNPDGEPKVNVNNQQQRQQLRQLLNDKLGQTRGNEVGARIPNGNVADIFDFALRLQLELEEFALLEDFLTTTGGQQPPSGRVNVNAAAREVLLCLEGLTEGDVDALLARRPSAIADDPTSIAWVLDVLKEKAIGLGNRITGHGTVYSADIVAVSGNGRAFRRVRVVVDAAQSPPRIIQRRDLSDLGWPLDRAILDELRAGGALVNGGTTGLAF